MATRIEALASFANSEELSATGGLIATGETAVVADEYAEELERQGLVEIIETDADGNGGGAEATEEGTSEGNASEGDTSEEGATEGNASQEGASEEDSFGHTEHVDEFATLTEELPHYELLAEAGIKTFDDLAGIAGDFEVIRGIGPSKAEDLSEAWDEIVSE